MSLIKRENRFKPEELLVDETIFSVANGFLGTRGTFTEGYGTSYEYNQTYLNGLYNYYDYHYEENLTGFPQQGQKFVNLLDGTKIEFLIEKVPLNLTNAEIINLQRHYDMKKGVTVRKIHYRTPDNFDFYLQETKLVSTKYQNVISINIELESPNFEGIIQIKSYLQNSKKSSLGKIDPRLPMNNGNQLEMIEINPKKSTILTKTTKSNLYVNSTMMHDIQLATYLEGDNLIATKHFKLTVDSPLSITKHIIHTSSLYDENYLEKTNDLSRIFSKTPFQELLKTEEEASTLFWDNSCVKIYDNPYYEKLLNYSIYQLNSQGGESTIHNISAKGLSGEGYEGHYFWDTEIYMIPFFTLTNPVKAKNLLMYRYNTLEESRKEARNLGYKNGVKIPWRTINGSETSPYYPAGSAQFHINSDVAYAVIKYFEATNDLEFLVNNGFEMLVETARFLAEAVNYHDGNYHLNSVTGPDEYTTVVDDNYYTNQMMQYHFKELVEIYNNHLEELSFVISKLGITSEEINNLQNISEKIYLPFSEELNIFVQDKNFLSKQKVNLEEIPKENFPLLLHYHPLYLYKHQVLKQADTMLALMLLDYEDIEILESTFNYYEPITTHDSSLSKCIYSIVAFKLNKKELALKYFKKVLETDYKDVHNNTKDGLHIANLGGSYLGFIYGLVGLSIHKHHIKINPRVTDDISKYQFSFMYQGNKVTITVDEKLTVETNGSVVLKVYDKIVEIDSFYQTDLPN